MPDSDNTSSTSSHGSNSSTITFNSSSDGSATSSQLQLSPASPSPSKFSPNAAESKLSSPLNFIHYTDSKLLSSPSPGRRPQNVKFPSAGSHTNHAVKKTMGLMKLRRQGSLPPAINGTLLHQAAAARELMASLERLSLSEKVATPTFIKNGGENAEREARRALLGEETKEEFRVAVLRGAGAQGLPLCAKIAAAMDAEGRIGVQKEIAEIVEGMMKERELQMMSAAGERKLAKKTKQKAKKTKQKRGSGRWIIRPKFRSTRTLLGKIWRSIKRLFSSSTNSNRAKKKLVSISKS
ncbi:hypothetical protein L7F22_032051 [Adiantum nelumboides]|nr:hypothetical protein [Adiantum nelumboides]